MRNGITYTKLTHQITKNETYHMLGILPMAGYNMPLMSSHAENQSQKGCNALQPLHMAVLSHPIPRQRVYHALVQHGPNTLHTLVHSDGYGFRTTMFLKIVVVDYSSPSAARRVEHLTIMHPKPCYFRFTQKRDQSQEREEFCFLCFIFAFFHTRMGMT